MAKAARKATKDASHTVVAVWGEGRTVLEAWGITTEHAGVVAGAKVDAGLAR